VAGRLQIIAAATTAAWAFSGVAADDPNGSVTAVPRPGAPAPGALHIGAGNAHERWSLVADAARDPWDPFESSYRSLRSLTPGLDASLAGEARHAGLAFDWTGRAPGSRLQVSARARHEERDLGLAEAPATSSLDERYGRRDRGTRFAAAIRATEDRGLFGWHGSRSVELRTANDDLEARGILGNAFSGDRREVRADALHQSIAAVGFAQELRIASRLRVETAAEVKRYRLGVESGAAAAGRQLDGTLPAWRAGLALSLAPTRELFAQVARGDAGSDSPIALRDPRDGAPLAAIDPAATGTVLEAGFRGALLPRLEARISAFEARTDSQVRFTGAESWSVLARSGVRSGLRARLRYEPAPWIALDLDATIAGARFGDGTREAIPGAASRLATAGATLRGVGGWTAKLFVSYLGPRERADEEPTRLRSSTVVNAQVARNLTKATRLTFDVFNVFNQAVEDMDPFAASRLAQPGSMDNFLFHPGEPRGFRLKLRTTF
jgi:hypothetical protein